MGTLQPRTLVFDQGSSDKFWSIRVDGCTHTVHFGRTGTAGQVKTKEFASADAAVAAAQKLLDAKLKKGYHDDGAAPAMPDPVEPAAPIAPARNSPSHDAPPPAAALAPAAGKRPHVDLAPHEWSLATWRPLHDPPTGEPPAFDPARLLEKIRTSNMPHDWHEWNWRSSPIRVPMSREEAAYWLRVGVAIPHRMTPQKQHAVIAAHAGEPDPAQALALARESWLPEGEAMAPLSLCSAPTRRSS